MTVARLSIARLWAGEQHFAARSVFGRPERRHDDGDVGSAEPGPEDD
jgi:hypothetical protein